jgi:CRP/FNR family transcriptional regulator, polysaccharide utilization system transcription regulator
LFRDFYSIFKDLSIFVAPHQKTKNSLQEKNFKIDKTARCFRYLSPEELELLNKKKIQLGYLKGETIFKQGAFAPYVLFVLDGLVRVYLQMGSQKNLNLQLARQGDFLAFSSVFGENVYTYSAAALKDSTLCMIDKEALKSLMMKNPEFAIRITSKNSLSESRFIDIIYNVTYKQMRGKLASALLYLSSEDFDEEDVFGLLTRQDIADFASITTESAIRFIKEFEKENILRADGRHIQIENRDLLEEISKKG